MNLSARETRIVNMRTVDKMKMTDIARAEGVTVTTVRKAFRQAGLESSYRPDKGTFWRENEAKLIELYNTSSLLITEIAVMLGPNVSPAMVSSQVKRLVRDKKVIARPVTVRDVERSTPATVVRDSVSAIGAYHERATWKPAERPPIPIPESVLVAFVPAPTKRPYTFWQLPIANGCRWPLGDGFCAEPIDTSAKQPYCSCHAALSRRPNFVPGRPSAALPSRP